MSMQGLQGAKPPVDSSTQGTKGYSPDQRANCNAYSDEAFACLYYATWPGTSVGLFRLLIAKLEPIDIDILTQDGKHRKPLVMLIKHFAEDRDWEYKFNALIEAGADVNRRDVNDISPLRCAVTEGSITAVKLLIVNGANREDFSIVPNKKHAMETELKKAWPTRPPSLTTSSRPRSSWWPWSVNHRLYSP